MVTSRRHLLFLPATLLGQNRPSAPRPQVATRPQNLSVKTFGATGDGKTSDTEAIQRALAACATPAGGRVVFPPGRYLCGSIQLRNNTTLHLETGATLLGSTNPADYRNFDTFREGTGNELGYAFVSAVDATNVGIEGSGTIDGQGKEVLAALKGERNRRPFLVRFVRCSNVSLRNVKLRSGAVWTVHLSQCHNVTAEGLNINSHVGSNNDGIDIDSCELVRISDCDIDTGDDAICLKATSLLPCRDIAITNCRLRSNCAAIKAGTESAGDFEHVRISDCQILGARLGGIKLLSVDGAHLENFDISNVTMLAGRVPVFLRLGARLKTFRVGDAKRDVGTLRNIRIRGMKAHAEGPAIALSGIPGHRIEQVRVVDSEFQLAGGEAQETSQDLPEMPDAYPEITMFGPHLPAKAVYARHVNGIELIDVKFAYDQPDQRPTNVLTDALDVKGLA